MNLSKQNIGNIVELINNEGTLLFLGKIYTINKEGNPVATNKLGHDGKKLFHGNLRLTVHISDNERVMFSCVCITYPNGDYMFSGLKPIEITDKRLSYRLNYTNLATISLGEEEIPALIDNISLGGIKIFCARKFKANDNFEICLNFPFKTEMIQCSVARVIEENVYGIQFINLNPTNVNELYDVLINIRYEYLIKQ